jgi:Sec-independent protein translocase protein TatA
MDDIFGIGLPEFILILVIAGMVMGPERIARTARSLGLLTARLQSISRSFFRQINAELDAADQDGQLRSTVEELSLLRRQVAELRNEVFTLATGTAAEGKQAISDIRRETQNSILPPSLAAGLKSAQAPPAGDAAGVHKPPVLFDNPPAPTTNGQAQTVTVSDTDGSPMPRPRRVEVAEDPD